MQLHFTSPKTDAAQMLSIRIRPEFRNPENVTAFMLPGFFKSRPRFSKVIAVLNRAELVCETRLRALYPSRLPSHISKAAIDRELHQYELVDVEAHLAAEALFRWYRTGIDAEFAPIRDQFCEPLLFRLRDAHRLLQETGAIPPEFTHDPAKFFPELLVDRWHQYAERFWRQRWVKVNLGGCEGGLA